MQLDTVSAAFLKAHEERADVAAVFVYITLSLSIAALAVMRFAPKHQYQAAAAVLAGCVLCTALLVWTAEAGGKIRHPEFRPAATAAVP